MPTFGEDLHLGHKVALIESDDLSDCSITMNKLAPTAVDNLIELLFERLVGEPTACERAGCCDCCTCDKAREEREQSALGKVLEQLAELLFARLLLLMQRHGCCVDTDERLFDETFDETFN